jgi:hypothetical protein
MGTQAGCAFTTLVLFLYYVWANRRRGDKQEERSEEAYMNPNAWAAMTDRENKSFRYTY